MALFHIAVSFGDLVKGVAVINNSFNLSLFYKIYEKAQVLSLILAGHFHA